MSTITSAPSSTSLLKNNRAFLPTLAVSRQFSAGQTLQALRKGRTVSKRLLQLRAKQRAARILARNPYNKEKLSLTDAIAVLRAVEVSAPSATYELLIRTAMKNGVTIPKGRINLPREIKPRAEEKILVFAEGRQAEEALEAGAHIVGGVELIDSVMTNRSVTTILCTPALIRAITPKLGRVLGPLGLMPSERRGTVTDDIAGYIERLQGSSEWRGDRYGTVRMPIAKLDFPVEDVVKNVRHFLTSVKRATGNIKDKGPTGKTDNKPVNEITKVILSSTKGPGIRIRDF